MRTTRYIGAAEMLHIRSPAELEYPKKKLAISTPLKNWQPITTEVTTVNGTIGILRMAVGVFFCSSDVGIVFNKP